MRGPKLVLWNPFGWINHEPMMDMLFSGPLPPLKIGGDPCQRGQGI